MPSMSGLMKFSWTLNALPASNVSCMSVELQPGVADRVPAAVLVLVRLGLTAVDLLHPCGGATEMTAVVGVVQRWVDGAGRQRRVFRGGDEVLPGQVGVGLV